MSSKKNNENDKTRKTIIIIRKKKIINQIKGTKGNDREEEVLGENREKNIFFLFFSLSLRFTEIRL